MTTTMTTTTTTTTIDEECRRRRIDRLREHMVSENEQDFERTIATFSHPRYELVPTGEVYDGADEVMGYYLRGRSVITDQRNEEIAIHVAGDTLILEFWLRGTHLGGPNPTGRAFEARMCAVFDFDEDDMITCERVYFDQQTISNQLRGVMPPGSRR
jgi:hypothetical protein